MGNKRRKIRQMKNLRDLDFKGPDLEISGETKRWIFIIILFVVGLLGVLSLLDYAGTFGFYFNLVMEKTFGVVKWIFPFILIIVGYFLVRPNTYGFKLLNIFGLVLFFAGLNGFLHTVFHQDELMAAAANGLGGGFVGALVAWPLLGLTGFWGAIIITLALFIIGFILLFEQIILNSLNKKKLAQELEAKAKIEPTIMAPIIPEEPQGFFSRLQGFFTQRRVKKIDVLNTTMDSNYGYDDSGDEEIINKPEAANFNSHDVADNKAEDQFKSGKILDDDAKLSIGASKFKKVIVDLPTSLLDGKSTAPKGGDLKANQSIIQRTLKNFGIPAEMGEARVGPTVTQYTLKPAEGVRLSKITGLSDNLALALAAHPIRVEAPIPGKSLVGIEVPNETKASVPLSSILNSSEFRTRESNLEIALGKDVMGKAWLYPLDKMPHLLIAGATGSGKSVCINTLILSLLFQNSPSDLKFIMVDPKRVELPLYNGIPHLITPVITDVKKTINALRWTIKEMENRFDILSAAGYRNIASYNEDHRDISMPYIVFIIDELADLMATSGPEVEAAIVRLAQMSRAVGIHLVLATQRPSVDVITGLIKANVPTRIAFSVASLVDSRTILDASGAEKLLGKGDMLFLSTDITKPKRIQGAFTSDVEIKKVIEHLKKQADPDYIDDVTERPASPTGFSDGSDTVSDNDDPLLLEAKDVIFKAKKASASLLQRRLRVGYARAARILDLLEEQGFIGPADGARPRELLSSAEPNFVQPNRPVLNDVDVNTADAGYDNTEVLDDDASVYQGTDEAEAGNEPDENFR